MSIITIVYTSDIVDDTVVIKNSMDDSIASNDPQELLNFLVKNYTNNLNRKVAWNLDLFLSVILKQLGLTICKELTNEEHAREAIFKFDDSRVFLYEVASKPQSLDDDVYDIFYNPKTIFGIGKGKQKRSYYYNLSQFFEDDSIITDIPTILDKAKELTDAFFSMGLNPLQLSSPVRVWESSILSHMDVPTIADLPPTLSENECDELTTWAEQCLKREWSTAYAVGHWDIEESFDYDISNAYGSWLSKLYNFRYADFSTGKAPEKAHWGILKGKITINDVKVSPIVYNENGHNKYPVNSSWEGLFTLPDIRFIKKWGIGDFKLDRGYFWYYTAPQQPYKEVIARVFNLRQKGGLVKKLAKRVGASAWGKHIQRNVGGVINKYYNPIFALQVETYTRLQVADFIYSNNLQDNVLHIGVDGVRTSRHIPIPEKLELGAWRQNEQEPCIILSPGRVYTPSNKPGGLYYEDAVNLLESNPRESYYQKTMKRRVTLAEAIMMNDLKSVGELREFSASLDLNASRIEQDQQFESFPKTGQQLLSEKYYSKPIAIQE